MSFLGDINHFLGIRYRELIKGLKFKELVCELKRTPKIIFQFSIFKSILQLFKTLVSNKISRKFTFDW